MWPDLTWLFSLCISSIFRLFIFLPRNVAISGQHNCFGCYQERSKSSLRGETSLLFGWEILWTNFTYKYKWINDVLQWRDLWTSCSMYKASFRSNLIFVVCFFSLQIFNHFRKDCSFIKWFKYNSIWRCSQSLNFDHMVKFPLFLIVYGKFSSSHCNINSCPGHFIDYHDWCHCFRSQGSVQKWVRIVKWQMRLFNPSTTEDV